MPTNPMAADNDPASGIELLDANGHRSPSENGFPFARAPEPRSTKRRCIFACLAAGALLVVAFLALPRDDRQSLQQTLASIDATLRMMATVGAALAGAAPPAADADLCAARNGTNFTNATWADVHVDYTADELELFLIIPDDALGEPFTVIATTRRVTGEDAGLAHYGVGTEDSFFVLRRAYHLDEVRVTRPSLEVRPVTDNYAGAQRDGLGDVGWSATLPIVKNRGCANRTVLDIGKWLMEEGLSVVNFGELCKEQAALRNATAFARNAQFVVACSAWDGASVYDEIAEAAEISYSLALLPEDVMEPRRADDRVGFFGSTYTQLGPLPKEIAVAPTGTLSDLKYADADARINLIHRWRLDKSEDCEGGLCRPVKPITYHLDPTIPAPLWDAIAAGVLAWIPAFEAIGFRDAIRVKRPTDADWPRDYDPGDVRFSSVTWLPYPDLGLAIGPSVVDARSGEILYANIVFGEGWVRVFTGVWLDEASLGVEHGDHGHGHGHEHHGSDHRGHEHHRGAHRGGRHDHRHCHRSAKEALAGLELGLLARGDVAPGEPLPAEFVRMGLKDVVAHEVGHTLGLRHNFKASALYSQADIHRESKRSRRVASSVMDYVSPVVAEDVEDQGAYFMEGVGVYDAYCMAYGYTVLEGSEDERHAQLLALAAKADGDRTLARADDLDALVANDPLAKRYDMTSDATEWCAAQRRLTLRALKALEKGALRADRAAQLSAQWSRAYEYYASAARRALGHWWGQCGTHLPAYARGLAYDRTERDEISKPVDRASRDRALDLLAAAWADPGLAVPPVQLARKAASFSDNEFKWGLSSSYDEWLQTAHDRRAYTMDRVLDWEALRWYDTLGWLGKDAYGSTYVLERLTGGLLTPVLAREADALDAAAVGAWLEKLRVLLRDAANATAYGAAAARRAGRAGAYQLTPRAPFNAYAVRDAARAGLGAAADLLANSSSAAFKREAALAKRALEEDGW